MKEEIFSQACQNLGIDLLNDIQLSTIKSAKKHSNLCLYAPTGSGKTLAFLLPILSQLKHNTPHIQSIIIVPSRELAQQIEQVWKKMQTGFKVLCCYGGHAFSEERKSLSVAPALIIGTPGRLLDHLQRETIDLNYISLAVIDEFDKCLELGFEQEMKEIFSRLSLNKRLLLTSATVIAKMPAFLSPNEFESLHFLEGLTPSGISFFKVSVAAHDDKLHHLMLLLTKIGEERCMIFCNHREAVERISAHLSSYRIENVYYHGGLEQDQRERALIKFRNSSSNILLTTDLGARGLDIPTVGAVIHYQFPHDEQSFVHRSGRTARMNATGNAYLIIQDGERQPDYLPKNITQLSLTEMPIQVKSPNWQTLFINTGKKDKLRKLDIVGMLSQKAKLTPTEIGIIEMYDHSSFVALPKSKMSQILKLIQEEKIKGKKAKFAVAQ